MSKSVRTGRFLLALACRAISQERIHSYAIKAYSVVNNIKDPDSLRLETLFYPRNLSLGIFEMPIVGFQCCTECLTIFFYAWQVFYRKFFKNKTNINLVPTSKLSRI